MCKKYTIFAYNKKYMRKNIVDFILIVAIIIVAPFEIVSRKLNNK